MLYLVKLSNASFLKLGTLVFQDDKNEKDMEVDIPSVAGQSHDSQKQSVLPEVEIFCYLLVTIFLIDQKQLEEVLILIHCSSFSSLLVVQAIVSSILDGRNSYFFLLFVFMSQSSNFAFLVPK